MNGLIEVIIAFLRGGCYKRRAVWISYRRHRNLAQQIDSVKPYVSWIGIAAALIILWGGATLQTLAGFSAGDQSGHAWGSDDAWISYQYAQNLFNGHGLVFNEGEHVEGYSNLLYVLLISIGFAFTDGMGIYVYSVVLNAIFSAAALIVFYQYIRQRFGDWVAVLGGLLFAMLPAVWVWTAAGLETPLMLLLQVGLWVSVERLVDEGEPRQRLMIAAIIAMLSVLTRADGFITPTLAVIYLFIKGHRRAALVIAIAAGFTLAANIIFRLAYYGYPLPNTYYVKVSGSILARVKAAMKQLLYYIPNYGLLPYLLTITVAILASLVDLTKDWHTVLKTLRFDIVLATGWLGYFLYTGGDTFDERFLLILLPLGFTTLFRMGLAVRSQRDLILISAPILLLFHATALISDPRYDYRAEKYDRWIVLGEFLGEEYPNSLLAIDGAGKTPFFSGLYTIDMLGLNDEFIAHQPTDSFRNPGHNKHDADYVFSRRPDVIAAWLVPYTVDMEWDMPQLRYQAEGYELRYLINSSSDSRGEANILDATALTDDEIKRLTVNGYEYGVLIRVK